jgi:hypothetical protein
MSEAVVQGPAPEIAMDNNPSPKADKTPEASPRYRQPARKQHFLLT